MDEKDDYFDDLLLLWISRYDYMPSWRLENHAHSYFQLIYCIDGKAAAECNDISIPLSPRTILFIKPKERHAINEIGEKGLKTLDVKFLVNNEDLKQKLLCLPSSMETVDEEIREALERIRQEGDEQDFEYSSRSRLFLAMILTSLIRECKPQKEINRLKPEYYYRENLSSTVIKFIAYIENNYRKPITSEFIENALNYTYRFISRLTKREIGLTPIEFLEHYRINIAKEQLSTTAISLKEIAEYIGYPNIHHFSRSFSRIVGMPPGQYRSSIMEGIRKDIFFSDGFVNENNTVFS